MLAVLHGGEPVLVWGCLSASGVGYIVQIDGIMNAKKILIHYSIPSGKRSSLCQSGPLSQVWEGTGVSENEDR